MAKARVEGALYDMRALVKVYREWLTEHKKGEANHKLRIDVDLRGEDTIIVLVDVHAKRHWLTGRRVTSERPVAILDLEEAAHVEQALQNTRTEATACFISSSCPWDSER